MAKIFDAAEGMDRNHERQSKLNRISSRIPPYMIEHSTSILDVIGAIDLNYDILLLLIVLDLANSFCYISLYVST